MMWRMRLRDRIAVAVSFVVLAGCSSGGGAATPTTGVADGGSAPSTSPSTPQTTERETDGDDAAAPVTVPPTTEPALPAVRIEDTIDPLADLRTYQAAHGMLPPGPEVGGRSTTPWPADGVCGLSLRATDANDEPFFNRTIVGCEFTSEAAALAHAREWADWYADGVPEVYGLAAQTVTPITRGDWSGSSVVTVPWEDDVRVVRSTSMVRQVGVRVYRVLAETFIAPGSGADVDAEATALADRQDAFVASVTIDPLQPGAGTADAADRLLLHGVFPTWDEFDAIAGAEPTSSSLVFWGRIDDHPPTVVESAWRSVSVGEASLSVSARRYELPGDAARAARWFELDCGDAAVEPVRGVPAAWRCTVGEESIAVVQHGDRTYRIVADAALPGYAGGAAVDALAVALESRLAEFGLDTGPEELVGVDAEFADGLPVRPDLLPDLSSVEAAADYALASVTFDADPATGLVQVSGDYELVAASFIDGGRFDVRLYLGAVDADLTRRYSGAVAPLEFPTDRWAPNDFVLESAGPGDSSSYRPFWSRRVGDVIVVVFTSTGQSQPSSERIAPLIQPVLDRVEAHVAGLGPVAAPSTDDIDLIVAARAAELMRSQPSNAYLTMVRVMRAAGQPIATSPAGAVADWWVEFIGEATADGSRIVLGPPDGQQRIVRFETEEQAEAFLQQVPGWSATAAQPTGEEGIAGWVPSADGQRGVFATRLGSWVFLMEDRSMRIEPQAFDDEGNPIEPRTTRDFADSWADDIWQSGLASSP